MIGAIWAGEKMALETAVRLTWRKRLGVDDTDPPMITPATADVRMYCSTWAVPIVMQLVSTP